MNGYNITINYNVEFLSKAIQQALKTFIQLKESSGDIKLKKNNGEKIYDRSEICSGSDVYQSLSTY